MQSSTGEGAMRVEAPVRPSARPWFLRGGGIAFLLALVALISGSTFSSIVYHPEDDEGIYRMYAAQVVEHGPSAFPDQFTTYRADPERWILPSPLRVGYVCLAALFGAVFGATLETLTCLALAAHLALVLLTWACVRRVRGERAGLAVAALVGLSALHLGLSRSALMDSVAALFQSASVWCFLALLARPERTLARIGFVLVYAATLLVKEPAVLFAPVFAATWWIERRLAATELSGRAASACLLAPLALAGLAWSAAAGGPVQLLDTVEVVRRSLATNTWAREFLGGPWYRYVVDAVLLSPWVTLLGVGWFGVLLARARSGAVDAVDRRFGLVLALALVGFSFLEKDIRYTMALHVPLAFFAWSLVEEVFLRSGRKAGRVLATACLLFVLATEAASFRRVFVQGGIYDPVTAWLMHARGLVPLPR